MLEWGLLCKNGTRVHEWLCKFFGPNWLGSRPQSLNFFNIWWFDLIQLTILDKMRSDCLWKLELRLWTDGLICLLGPSGPNVVSRHQTQRSRSFLRYHDFIGFILWVWRNWGPVWAIPWKGQPECENQVLYKTLIIWYNWKAETFRNSLL